MSWGREQWSIVAIGGIVVVVVATALALDRAWDSHAPIGWAVGASAVITFVGFLAISAGDMIPRLRIAIAASFVVAYVVLLGMVTFLIEPTDGGSSEVSSTLVTNFTVLMGTVVAFFFGSSAVEKVAKINAVARRPDRAEEIEAAARDDVHLGPPPPPPLPPPPPSRPRTVT